MGEVFFGRRLITTSKAISSDTIVSVVQTAMTTHTENRREIEYLEKYHRGDQPIRGREKVIRSEIKNIVIENRAMEIVSFKTGYLVGEPVQYVAKGEEDVLVTSVGDLNKLLDLADKPELDEELVEWLHICGLGYRMIMPNPLYVPDSDEAPFVIYTLDPRDTFVVHANDAGKTPVLACKVTLDGNGKTVVAAYSDDSYWEITDGSVTKTKAQALGIPIVEYKLNRSRMGAFEPVLSLLDAINVTESNRVDGVEQFIQAILKFKNVDMDEGKLAQLKEYGAIWYRDIDANFQADISYLESELSQDQTQVLVDNMYDTILTICGMPNRNGGSSTSDTGTAVIMRDGWSDAEARAKKSELAFKKCEKVFMRKLLHIMRTIGDIDIRLIDIETRFTRRNYENIASKSAVLLSMLSSNKIAPILAFTHCGMFADPELAYNMSMEYAAEQEAKALALAQQTQQGGEEDLDNKANPQNNTTDPAS